MAADIAATSFRLRRRQLRSLLPRANALHDVPRLPQPRKRTEMDTLVQDLRYAIRQFVHRPGFTAIAVLSLALAIGGNSLIYGMLDGFVFHPFPYPEPDRLVAVGVTFPKMSADTTYVETLSPAEYLDIRMNRTFEHVGSFDLGNRNISGGDVPERVFTALLLDDLFPVVGMTPALGRGFTREELGPNGPPAAIISHRLWQSRFGGDPSILNRAYPHQRQDDFGRWRDAAGTRAHWHRPVDPLGSRSADGSSQRSAIQRAGAARPRCDARAGER